MKKAVAVLMCLLIVVICGSCKSERTLDGTEPSTRAPTELSTNFAATEAETLLSTSVSPKPTTNDEVQSIIESFLGVVPTQWSEKMAGIVDTFVPEGKELALTFDACGGKHGDAVDKELLDFLVARQIPATLFVNARWIDSNPVLFMELANNPLFEIENHGFSHRPLCVTPRDIYGIEGTDSVAKAVEEIKLNEDKIFSLTNRKTKFFRSGTAYYDDVAVQIANRLGYRIAGFRVNGDAGATFSATQIVTAMRKCQSGDIVICHFNQPQKQTAEGLRLAIPQLQAAGFTFVKLEDRISNLQ